MGIVRLRWIVFWDGANALGMRKKANKMTKKVIINEKNIS